MEELFIDRFDAGRRLAENLWKYAANSKTVVLALPRGGVPVAYEVASRLGLPMDVFLVRKLGVPGQRELAMGAVAAGGVVVENDEVIQALGIPHPVIEDAAAREFVELERRLAEYRSGRPALDVQGWTVILVDDGLATGSTMQAAVEALRRQKTGRIVVAVPVGARRTCERLCHVADEVVCLVGPEDFRAVGEWYMDFRQISDAEVQDLLRRVQRYPTPAGA
jgi:putative phosphoribosyl transferase